MNLGIDKPITGKKAFIPFRAYRHGGGGFQSQRGSVLVMAVFFVSIIVVLATRFTGDFQLSIARTEQQLVHTQLQQFLYSAESLASAVLIDDAKKDDDDGRYIVGGLNGSYDHLQEDWNNKVETSIDEATINGTVYDALSRFNLNQLDGRPQAYNPNGVFTQRFTVEQKRFSRLLQTHPDNLVDAALAQSITDAVIDWIDSDDTSSGIGGAENGYYNSLDPPYRAANRLFISPTELKQVKGISPEIYTFLEPLVVTLPNDVGININTALPEVLRSLNQQDNEEPLSAEDASSLMNSRPADKQVAESAQATTADVQNDLQDGFQSVAEFLASDAAARVFGTDEELLPPTEGLRTGSEYFILEAEVTLQEYQREQLSLIQRYFTPEGFRARVIRRTREQL